MDHHEHNHATMAHDAHAGHGDMGMMTDMRRRFFFCLILSVPVLLLEPLMGWTPQIGQFSLPLTFTGSHWLSLVFATLIFLYGGWPFLTGAVGEFKQHQPAMMALIALGILVSYGYSLLIMIVPRIGGGMSFLVELVTLIDIMLFGHWLEMRAVMRAGAATTALAALIPDDVHIVTESGVRRIPLANVEVGDRIQVAAGERIPLDGVVVSGTSDVDESLLTGESRPVNKKTGDDVTGGALNGNGTLVVTVAADRTHGFLAQVDDLVMSAQMQKSQAEDRADRVAGWLFYAAIIVAVLAFAVWTRRSGVGPAIMTATTVLVIACPHALGLAIPLVIARATALSANAGLLVRDRNAYTAGRKARYVLFDKTGTLTLGQFSLQRLVPTAGTSPETLLAVAAGLELGSSHPIATGILTTAAARHVEPAKVTAIQALPGEGLTGRLGTHGVAILTVRAVKARHLNFDYQIYNEERTAGHTISLVVQDNVVIGLVAMGDTVKPDAVTAITSLKQMGYTPVMLTGDNAQAATGVAATLGITEVAAELLPADKVERVRDYQTRGRVVMVGDGINDAPSLAQADSGIAIGAGTEVAQAAADVVLVQPQLQAIVTFLGLTQRTSRKMTQNLWWGAGYNLFALPLAAGVLAPFDITLAPAVGGLLMTLSTIVVAINALALRLPSATK